MFDVMKRYVPSLQSNPSENTSWLHNGCGLRVSADWLVVFTKVNLALLLAASSDHTEMNCVGHIHR